VELLTDKTENRMRRDTSKRKDLNEKKNVGYYQGQVVKAELVVYC